jgi:solute carrier family 13 (sodium-dependent dicarboxylate transporter), member 2/3/5
MAEASIPLQRGGVSTEYSTRQRIGLALGPLAFLLMLILPNPAGMSPEAAKVAATTLWVAIWWMTEAAPIPVTSLLPLILIPMTGALPISDVTPGYSNRLIFVFLGGFMIALAIERWNLHRRIALSIISVVGVTPARIVLGFMVATGFLSMWISNTATAMMMTPIGLAVISQMLELMDRHKDTSEESEEQRNMARVGFATALMLGIAYSASLGGIGTLIGTPPNIVLAGAAQELFGLEISFARWMLIGLPVAIIGVFGVWFYLTRIAYTMDREGIPGGLDVVRDELRKLGPMTTPERAVLIIFGLTALAWITRPWVISPIAPNVDDAVIALTGAVVLFVVPLSLQRNEFLMDWETARNLPWGIVLLFGGGLAIAAAFTATGLSDWLGAALTGLNGLPVLLVLLVVVTIVIFLTELTSNTASATMLMPVMFALSAALLVNPLLLMVPAAIAASCAFMLPVATPPNAIVFGSGYITIPQMARTGIWLNLAGIILVTAIGYLLVPLIWSIAL